MKTSFFALTLLVLIGYTSPQASAIIFSNYELGDYVTAVTASLTGNTNPENDQGNVINNTNVTSTSLFFNSVEGRGVVFAQASLEPTLGHPNATLRALSETFQYPTVGTATASIGDRFQLFGTFDNTPVEVSLVAGGGFVGSGGDATAGARLVVAKGGTMDFRTLNFINTGEVLFDQFSGTQPFLALPSISGTLFVSGQDPVLDLAADLFASTLVFAGGDYFVADFANTADIFFKVPAGVNAESASGVFPIGIIGQDTATTVPEPVSLTLLALGLLGWSISKSRNLR